LQGLIADLITEWLSLYFTQVGREFEEDPEPEAPEAEEAAEGAEGGDEGGEDGEGSGEEKPAPEVRDFGATILMQCCVLKDTYAS
jgi:hypothetical protein